MKKRTRLSAVENNEPDLLQGKPVLFADLKKGKHPTGFRELGTRLEQNSEHTDPDFGKVSSTSYSEVIYVNTSDREVLVQFASSLKIMTADEFDRAGYVIPSRRTSTLNP